MKVLKVCYYCDVCKKQKTEIHKDGYDNFYCPDCSGLIWSLYNEWQEIDSSFVMTDKTVWRPVCTIKNLRELAKNNKLKVR